MLQIIDIGLLVIAKNKISCLWCDLRIIDVDSFMRNAQQLQPLVGLLLG